MFVSDAAWVAQVFLNTFVHLLRGQYDDTARLIVTYVSRYDWCAARASGPDDVRILGIG